MSVRVEPLPEAEPTVVRYIEFGPAHFDEGVVRDWDRLDEMAKNEHVAWIDVDGLGSAEAIDRLAQAFDLHHLAVEDSIHVHQRSKVEVYPNHLFIVARMAQLDRHLNTEQLSLFLGRNYVLTIQEGRPGDCLENVRERLRKGYAALRENGADYLTYAILDSVIDSYFPVVEAFGDQLSDLDDRLSDSGMQVPLSEIHRLRSELLLMRRSVWPHREAINQLLRETHQLIKPETRIYLRDCYDHVLQIIDVVETYREVCSDLRDFYMSLASHRANEIMKVLTIISTIFIPLSFIAGIYGMNFRYMPELEWKYGYVYALAVMGVFAMGLITYVFRRGWFRA